MSATNVRPPTGVTNTANEFNVLKFTGGAAGTETNHAVNALPDVWQGKWVTMYVTGGNMHYAITKFATAEVDRAVAATAAGVSTKVGGVVPNGTVTMFRLPYIRLGQVDGSNNPEKNYFARESDAVGTVAYLWMSDEPGVTRSS